LSVLAGHDPRRMDADTPGPNLLLGLDDGVRGMRMAWSSDFGNSVPASSAVVDVVRQSAQAFEQLGAHIEERQIRFEDTSDVFRLSPEFTREPGTPLAWFPEALELMADPAKAQLVCPYVSLHGLDPIRGSYSLHISPAVRYAPVTRLQDVLRDYDVLLSPTISRVATVCEATDFTASQYTEYTAIANLTGHPAASLPAGLVDGMPVGLHVIGRRGEEATVLRVSRSFETAMPWAHRRPAIQPT
jgi:aspartyl-tRNA(Asn)/glutamyl-tRNA(Gln) amidotransferase subunit A